MQGHVDYVSFMGQMVLTSYLGQHVFAVLLSVDKGFS